MAVGQKNRWWLMAIPAAMLAILVVAILLWQLEGIDPQPQVPVQLTPLTSDGGQKRDPRLSLDGKKVAFWWSGPNRDNYDIYIKPIGPDTTYLQVTSDPAIDAVPVCGNQDIWIIDLQTRELARITDELYPWCSNLSWSDDGEEIVFTAGYKSNQRVYRVNLEERVPTPVLGLGTNNPEASLVGDTLVCLQVVKKAHNIWRVPGRLAEDLKSPPREWISSSFFDGNASFSPNVESIAFCSDRSGLGQIWVANRDGSNPRRLTDMKTEAGSPRWSPDSRRIVFDSYGENGSYEIYVVGVETQQVTQLTKDPADDSVASFSHDGKWIYFTSERGGTSQIWKIPSEGGAAIPVTKEGGAFPLESWDRQQVYYADGRGGTVLKTVPVSGGRWSAEAEARGFRLRQDSRRRHDAWGHARLRSRSDC